MATRTRLRTAAVILVIVIPFGWCFGSVMTSARVFAYRDVAHFYYPLYAWMSESWSRHEIPLWNPYDNNGVPLVAETTSAVFYPGKLLFALPFSYTSCFNLYVTLHVLLAAIGAFVLARQWKTSIWAAGLCGVSYGYGGAVLFQYCNVVFLVGAAWLPLALAATDRALAKRSVTWSLVLGLVLAMMTLGGDPQSAYHTGLLAALYAVFTRGPEKMPAGSQRRLSLRRHPLGQAVVLLGIAAISGLLLSAIQIVPALLWTPRSERAVFQYPRSVYEIPVYVTRHNGPRDAPARTDSRPRDSNWRGVARGLFGPPPAGTHHQRVYDFSIAPWRLTELLWANSSGRTFPRNHRWLRAMRAEDRIWTPSLYLGVLPFLLAIGSLRIRSPDRRLRWLAWVVVLSAVASFGWYGPGLAIREVAGIVAPGRDASGVGAPTGGVYWSLVTFLPGYSYFRYPAKWFVVTSLGVALLSALGLDRMLASADRRDRLRRWLMVLGVLSAAVGIALIAVKPWWARLANLDGSDELFGPFDLLGAATDIVTACGHTAVVCGLSWMLLRVRRPRPKTLAAWIVVITAGEVAWANGWMILTAPASAMHTATMLDGTTQPSQHVCFYRMASRLWVPRDWPKTSSKDRAAETLQWDQMTLYGKSHLLKPLRSVHAPGTLESLDYRAFLRAAGDRIPHAALLNVLGTQYLVLPRDMDWPQGKPIDVASVVSVRANVRLWANPAAFPRAWIVHDVQRWPRLRSFDPTDIQRYYRAMLLPDGRPRDFRVWAAVTECGAGWPRATTPGGTARGPESCAVTLDSPKRVEVEVTLTEPGLVVLNNGFHDGWQCQIATRQDPPRRAEILRTNGVMQGVYLPAGHHRLTFRFLPADLYWPAGITLLSWLVLVAVLGARITRWIRSRRGAGPRRSQIW